MTPVKRALYFTDEDEERIERIHALQVRVLGGPMNLSATIRAALIMYESYIVSVAESADNAAAVQRMKGEDDDRG